MQNNDISHEGKRKRIPEVEELIFDRDTLDIILRIKRLLTLKGMDQKILADTLGKKETEISEWLSGTYNFSIKTLARISAALGEPILRIIQLGEDEQAGFKEHDVMMG